MPVKDYYKTLNVSPNASTEEIRKAFRKLAQIHHPDKHAGSLASAALYSEIQEAYLVLGNRQKRADYQYYIYREGLVKKQKPLAESPEDILSDATRLNNYLATQDQFRINREFVFLELQDLLSFHNLQIIRECGNKKLIQNLLQQLAPAMRHLSFQSMNDIYHQLEEIFSDDTILFQLFLREIGPVKKEQFWHRYKVLFVLLITLLICFFLFFTG